MYQNSAFAFSPTVQQALVKVGIISPSHTENPLKNAIVTDTRNIIMATLMSLQCLHGWLRK